MVDIKHMERFVAVAENLSFRRAAKQLRIAQPPLSASIRQLEEELGVSLLDRDRQSVSLTHVGKAYLVEARRAIEQVNHAALVAQRVQTGEIGQLRLAVALSATYCFLPKVLREYRGRYPSVSVEVNEAGTNEALKSLEADEVDVACVRSLPYDADKFETTLILRDRLAALLPADHPLAGKKNISLNALASEPFVAFSTTRSPIFHQQTVSACRRAGFTPRIVQHGTHTQTIVSLVAGGLGVALVPYLTKEALTDDVVLVPIADRNPELPIDLYGIRRKDAKATSPALFIEVAKSVGRLIQSESDKD